MMLWILVLLELLGNVVTQSSNKGQGVAPVITKQPSSIHVRKGGIAELSCKATGTAPLRYDWFHEGKKIQSGRILLTNGTLYISRLIHKRKKGYSDTGSYYCDVSNKYGSAKSRVVNITLGYIRNSFRKHPKSLNISQGSRVELNCVPPRGRPKPLLRWMKNGHYVREEANRILFERRNQILIIKRFKKDDEGTYVCEASNAVGRKLSNPARLTSKVRPEIVERPNDTTVSIGTDRHARFSCKATGTPTPKIEWRRLGDQTVLPSTDGTLTLTNLKISDHGMYVCTASNSLGTESAQAFLNVNYPPQFTVVSPNTNVKEGERLELSCLANARPSPAILWMNEAARKFFKPHERYGNIHVNQDDRTVILVISPVRKSDEGNYTCQATNEVGSKKSSVSVSVHSRSESAPAIKTNVDSVTADINSNQTFFCDVEGSPKPSVTWFKVGQGHVGDVGIIRYNYSLGKRNRYVLNIPKVQESDRGKFRCQAVNKINTATRDVVLKVTNKIHLSQAIGVGVPPMPTGVTVRDWTHNSVLIRWKMIRSTAGPLLSYAVGYIDIDARSGEKYASSNISPLHSSFSVEDLKPDTQYRFFVQAVNKNGLGVPSLLSNVVRTNTFVPTKPTLSTLIIISRIKLKIRVRPAGPGELVVSWEKPKIYQLIDGYNIYWKLRGSGSRSETLLNNQAERYTISHLQNSTEYGVRVRVFKNNIRSRKSSTVFEKTSDESIVLTMDIKGNDTDSIVVSWKRLWKKNSGTDRVKYYTIWYAPVNNAEEKKHQVIPAHPERLHSTIGGLSPGEKYEVWMIATSVNGATYRSKIRQYTLKSVLLKNPSSKPLVKKIEEFVLQPWFLGLLGGLLLVVLLILIICCVCKRSSSKKDDLPIPLQDANRFESIRKPSDSQNTESVSRTPSRGRESCSDGESLMGRSSRDYRRSGSPSAPSPTSLNFPQIEITPNKYERICRSANGRTGDEGASFGRLPHYASRTRNPYSPSPKPGILSVDNQMDYEHGRGKYSSTASNRSHSPARSPYPDAPPDYETAVAENTPRGEKADDRDDRSVGNKDLDDNRLGRVPYKNERYGNPSSRQSSCSPGSECSNQGSSVAGRRKGLKPLPRLTIASVNWADMLPPPPSHPPPSSVATRSPPPSPTGTSMCSETTYGRSHASSFLPRRSASVVSGDITSDLEKATADSVLSGKSKGKSENKLPFDLAGITSDIIMQWADSVTNTSGSEEESPCSSPSRVSGISSDGSFLTDTDFANAVKAAAECGGFNIDIDLNMYKDMDPISFQPFAGSLSTYNPDNSGEPSKDSEPSAPTKKVNSGSKDGMRDGSRSGRSRRSRPAGEGSRDNSRPSNSSIKETSPLITPTADSTNNKKPRKVNEMNANGSAAYVPALTRTSALGKLEPVNRGPVKKKYAVVKTLPQVQAEDGTDYPANYPSHSLSSSTSNASTIRSSSCPPAVLTDDDMEDDLLLS